MTARSEAEIEAAVGPEPPSPKCLRCYKTGFADGLLTSFAALVISWGAAEVLMRTGLIKQLFSALAGG